MSLATTSNQPPIRRQGPEDKGDPRREVLLGLALCFLFFVVLLGWAAVTPLDAAAYGRGQVTVASHRQEVQHKEGGVVRAINVKEGQHVQAGEVLIELAGADAQAKEQSLESQVLGLEALRARLEAEQLHASSIAWPKDLLTATGPARAEADRVMQVQKLEFKDRAVDVSSHKAVLRQRIDELADQIDGYQRQMDAAAVQQRLIGDELTDVKSLSDRGYAPISRVRALQRDQADLQGRHGEFVADIAQARQQTGEMRMQMLQLDADQDQDVSKELRDADFQLNDVLPKLREADDELSRVQVRAPMSGTVVGLTAFTVGGVIAPGQKLLDVVPDRSDLLVEVQITPAEVDGLHVGQTAEVRLGAEPDRSLPILKGTMTALSADSLTNERTGAQYFVAEVVIPADQLALLKNAHVPNFDLRPGLPAQVVIPTAKRTALQYIFDPLSKTMWRSFRER